MNSSLWCLLRPEMTHKKAKSPLKILRRGCTNLFYIKGIISHLEALARYKVAFVYFQLVLAAIFSWVYYIWVSLFHVQLLLVWNCVFVLCQLFCDM